MRIGYKFEPVFVKRVFKFAVKRRPGEEVEVCSEEVVPESGKRYLRGTYRPARLIVPFEDEHLPAGFGEVYSGDYTVMPRPDDNGVIGHCRLPQARQNRICLPCGDQRGILLFKQLWFWSVAFISNNIFIFLYHTVIYGFGISFISRFKRMSVIRGRINTPRFV